MSGQISIASLNCLKCGATLEIGPNINQFNCGYCGAAQVVQRGGGIIALSLMDAIQQVRVGTDKTAAELAIARIQGEIKQLQEEQQALNVEYQKRREANKKSFSNGLLGLGLGICFVWVILAINLGKQMNDSIGIIASFALLGLAAALFAMILIGKNN